MQIFTNGKRGLCLIYKIYSHIYSHIFCHYVGFLLFIAVTRPYSRFQCASMGTFGDKCYTDRPPPSWLVSLVNVRQTLPACPSPDRGTIYLTLVYRIALSNTVTTDDEKQHLTVVSIDSHWLLTHDTVYSTERPSDFSSNNFIKRERERCS